ncbi:hypothetical protein ABZ479_31200 [Streptomyces sp. NPDC005722]
MTEPSKAEEATRLAIEFLTLWLEDDREGAARHIAGVVEGLDGAERMRMVAGLLNLNMFVVLDLAKARGAEDYRADAGAYLRHLAAHLPEVGDPPTDA